jgi:two-component system LytT family response regulator
MEKDFLKIPNGKSIHAVTIKDIVHITSKGAYSVIHLSTGEKHACAKGLGELFERLSNHKYFYRPHKSHVVNLNKVKQYRSTGRGAILVMTCGSWVRVSKREKPGFLSVYRK